MHLRAPVLEPPAIRVFDGPGAFSFANPTAIRSPGSEIPRPDGRLDAATRLAAVIGADGAIAGWTGLVEWRAPGFASPEDRDFALLLGPVVETEFADRFDWEAARTLAAANTRLRPGDLLAGPVLELHEGIASGGFVVVFDGLGEPPRSSADRATAGILWPCPSTSGSATSRASGTSSSATTARCSPRR